MSGIVSAGAAIPAGRFDPGPGERALAGPDEDVVTLAVEAAESCLARRDPADVDALFLATNSSPYAEGSAASVVASLVGLPEAARVVDLGGSLRAGMTALSLAEEAVEAGRCRQALAVASEVRRQAEGCRGPDLTGDGAVAFLLAEGNPAAVVAGRVSVTGARVGPVRLSGEKFLRSTFGDGFRAVGYVPAVGSALKLTFTRFSLRASSFARVLLDAPDGRSRAALAAEFGFDVERQFPREPLHGVGHLGAAHPLLLLLSALEHAAPGDRLLLAGWGDGADAIVVDVGPGADEIRARAPLSFARERVLPLSREEYVARREMRTGGDPGPTEVPEVPVDGFAALLCGLCGSVYAMPLRVCPACQEKDGFSHAPLGRTGIIYTYTIEYPGEGRDPVPLAVVNLMGGGRTLVQLTDTPLGDIGVGKDVELVVRKMYEGPRGPVYYLKARLQRGEE